MKKNEVPGIALPVCTTAPPSVHKAIKNYLLVYQVMQTPKKSAALPLILVCCRRTTYQQPARTPTIHYTTFTQKKVFKLLLLKKTKQR